LIGKADDIKPFLVHKETVCHYSPVLRAAFISDSVEGQAQTYRLEDTSEGAFRFFAQWIHHQRFELDYHKDAAEKQQDSEEDPDCGCGGHLACKNQMESLFKLLILAEKLLVPQLQNRVIDVLCRLNRRCRYTPENYDLVYSETSEGHPLRRFIIDQALWREIPDYKADFRAELPHDMAVDMLRKLFGMSDEQIDVNRKKWLVMEAEDYYVNGSRKLLCE
jgi:hypothetical protein